jgi:hypothetical protein
MDDGIDSANRPEHARLLYAATDYGFAASFDHPCSGTLTESPDADIMYRVA